MAKLNFPVVVLRENKQQKTKTHLFRIFGWTGSKSLGSLRSIFCYLFCNRSILYILPDFTASWHEKLFNQDKSETYNNRQSNLPPACVSDC